MKVKVEIFGSLRKHISNYDRRQGLEVEMPDSAKVKDLLVHLRIPLSDAAMITADKRLVKLDDELMDGAAILILPIIGGG